MKLAASLVLLALCAAAQGVDWTQVRPIEVRLPVPEDRPRQATRIIGGSEATRNQFPYQAGLIVDNVGFCGASLISSTAVITAAHCVDKHTSFEVHLGAHVVFDSSEPNHKVVTTSNTVVHPGWAPNILNHDIAIIKWASPITGTGISPVALPRRSDVGVNLTSLSSRITGWGLTTHGGVQSDVLKYADMSVISNADCEFLYGEFVITADKLCVGTSGGAVGVCNGDSGGPLVINRSGVQRQFGVVSFGSSRGCQSGDPQGFTRVTSYLDWIATNGGVTIDP